MDVPDLCVCVCERERAGVAVGYLSATAVT